MKNDPTYSIASSEFASELVATVKKHIDKKGLPASDEKCPLREEFRTENRYRQKSKRITWLCRARTGLFLSDWKCVGLKSTKCIFCVAAGNKK